MKIKKFDFKKLELLNFYMSYMYYQKYIPFKF